MLGTVYSPGKLMLYLAAFILLVVTLVTGGRVWAGPRTLLNVVGRYMIAEETLIRTAGYNTMTTPGFLIRYQGQPADALIVAKASENAQKQVDAYFGNPITKRIPVVVYNTTEGLAGSMGWDRSQQAMGVYWAGTIRVLKPSAWVKGTDSYNDFYLNGPMVHEYAHMQIDQLTGGNYPRWFTEGLAQYVEKQIIGFQFAVPETAGQPYTLDQLGKQFDDLDEAQAYWQSLTAVEYIIEKYGDQAPFELMDLLKKGYTMPESLNEVTGSYQQLSAQLDRQWH